MKTRIFLFAADFVSLSTAFFLSKIWFGLESKSVFLFFTLFLSVKGLIFFRLGLYRSILKFSGFPFAATIIKATAVASLLCYIIVNFPSFQQISPGFFATDYLLTTFLIGLTRFAPRFFAEFWQVSGSKKILIYGAGVLGEEVARKLLRTPGEYRLVGFIDDKPSKIGHRLHNIPIYGPISNLNTILAKHRASELIIAISALEGEVVRKIARECRRHRIFCRIVPTLTEMLKNQDISIKNIDIKDLLKREPKDLDEPQIRKFIKDKVIVITGAGGSIGSELTRQCIHYGAKALILFDHSEFNLYALQEELSSSSTRFRFCLMNILGSGGFEQILQEEKPSILFHAAAYKHVPMVEDNPFAGVYNNIRGTVETARLAEKYGIEKYVLISTDKAVRPTNVMGASKRIAELYIQNLNARSKAEFIAVRFGNVLGSSGSVIPKFIEQINKGGPVTVTHPDVTRYFMLIEEAIQLTLQAASIGNGGEIFILNMGNPVLISEMAEDLIFLSGREPHQDIKVEFTGLRPGEKLYEELLHDETEKKTQYENITIGHATYVNWNSLNVQIDDLLLQARNHDYDSTLACIKALVPEFSHANLSEKHIANIIPLHSSYKSS